jgi:hypothetical protein
MVVTTTDHYIIVIINIFLVMEKIRLRFYLQVLIKGFYNPLKRRNSYTYLRKKAAKDLVSRAEEICYPNR